jgi:hypothetical protein
VRDKHAVLPLGPNEDVRIKRTKRKIRQVADANDVQRLRASGIVSK